MTRVLVAQRNTRSHVLEYVTWEAKPGDTVIVPVALTAQRKVGSIFVFDGHPLQVIGHQGYTHALVCEVLAEAPEVF